MNVNLLHDRVLVKRVDPETKTESGIVFTDSAAEQNHQGDVIAVGKGRVTEEGNVIPLTVKAGDKVLYHPQAGIKVTLEGEIYLVMKEAEIFCVLE